VTHPPAASWTILIPTVGQRATLFARLLDVLLPQTLPYQGRVRVLGYWNNGEPALPAIRQALLEAAPGEYVSFVDDDDLVPTYYVADTMAALTHHPDYVGWQVQYHVDGEPRAVCYHSLRFRSWYEADGALYRDISHINPVRADLARRADFRRARRGWAEDRVWAHQLRGRLRTEVYLNKVMYLYLWSAQTSVWRNPQRLRGVGLHRPTVDHPNFGWHPDS
jgi:hypothetical protein